MIAGFALTFCVGLVWVMVGVSYKLMAKWNQDFVRITLLSNIFSVLILLVFVTDLRGFCSGKIPLPSMSYLWFVTGAGIASIAASYIQQISMKYGKSGVFWAIGQSYLILPFVLITLIYSEPWLLNKVIGTAIIVIGIFVLSAKQEQAEQQTSRPKLGLLLSFIAFVIYGISSAMMSATSYFSYQDTGRLRTTLCCAGYVIGLLVYKGFSKDWSFKLSKKALFLIVLSVSESILTLVLQFKALDILSRYSMNAIFYPAAVGVCIGGYAICSVLFFKEKATKAFIFGTLLIVAGILAFAF